MPAISAAFASACTTISYFCSLVFNRSCQSCTFFGKPLYPSPTTIPLASTTIAPILLLGSFDHWDICIAMARYRSSQLLSRHWIIPFLCSSILQIPSCCLSNG